VENMKVYLLERRARTSHPKNVHDYKNSEKFPGGTNFLAGDCTVGGNKERQIGVFQSPFSKNRDNHYYEKSMKLL